MVSRQYSPNRYRGCYTLWNFTLDDPSGIDRHGRHLGADRRCILDTDCEWRVRDKAVPSSQTSVDSGQEDVLTHDILTIRSRSSPPKPRSPIRERGGQEWTGQH